MRGEQVYHIPIHRSLQGILTQLRLRVGLEAAEDPGRTSASLSPKRGDAFEIDWVSDVPQMLLRANVDDQIVKCRTTHVRNRLLRASDILQFFLPDTTSTVVRVYIASCKHQAKQHGSLRLFVFNSHVHYLTLLRTPP